MSTDQLHNNNESPKQGVSSKALTIASLLALGLSLWMAFQTLSGSNLPGCGGGSGCESALYTRWGQWFSVPVSLIASILYCLTTLLSTSSLSSDGNAGMRRWLVDAHSVFAVLILAAVGWFVYLQIFELNAICKYCLVVHAVGSVVAALLLQRSTALRQQQLPHNYGLARPALVTVSLLGMFFAGQYLGTAPETHSLSQYRFGGGAIRISNDEAPIYGNPEAEFVFLELFDYTCDSCRELAPMLVEARERYGDQLAVVLVPCPLERKCNPYTQSDPMAHENACDYARCALTVWLASPDLFEEFHEWLLLSDPMPTIAAARGRGESLVGSDTYDRFDDDERIDRLITLASNLYRQQQQATMPKLISGEQQISGVPRSSAALFEALEQISKVRQRNAE